MRRPKGLQRKRGNHKPEEMLRALQLLRAGSSLRQAAKQANVKFCTLCRYAKKYANIPTEQLKNQKLTPNYAINKVFTQEQEEMLMKFLKECAKNLNGLTNNETRRATYELAVAYKLDVPDSWSEKKTSGIEWLRGFKERHPEFSLKKPDNIYRNETIDEETVKAFSDSNKVEVLVREKRKYVTVNDWTVLPAGSGVNDELETKSDSLDVIELPIIEEEESPVSVWSYFERESNGSARCAICRTVVPRSLMKGHMQDNHPKLIVETDLASDADAASDAQEDVYTEIVYLEDDAKKTPKSTEKKKRSVEKPKPRKRQLSESSDEVPLKQTKTTKTEDEIDQFAKFITTLLKKLPTEDCMELQMEIVNMIMKRQLELKKKEAEAKTAEVEKNGECSRLNLDGSATSAT